ncbi:MlaD family protein [Desulfoferula mesophila]|uniref:Paraquat-inducible protein B n=1 Tax=Desulfoferula mesophila TaxID=3058419 RepID=A0AAU9ES62_9BACT|nr:paraquat-inducible protein B [Desulfoferula mesophilus]
MSKQVNNKMVGGFLVTALALLVVGVMIFGSGTFFEKTETRVMHFQGAIKGLTIGSPVLLKGVKVGTVSNIVVNYDPSKLTVDIPVYIALNPSSFSIIGGEAPKTLEAQRKRTKDLIAHGLRAQLQTQSLITGQLVVALDFFPDTPVKLVNPDGPVIEIPTIPSALDQLSDTLKRINLDEIATQTSAVLEGLAKLVNAPELKASLKDLQTIMQKTKSTMSIVESRAQPLADEVVGTVTDTRKLVNQTNERVARLSNSAEAILQKTDNGLGPLVASLNTASNTATDTLLAAKKALEQADNMLGKDSHFRYQINNALEELAAAASSIRDLAAYLERHPEALIEGKK